MIKRYATMMSFDVPESEKRVAEKAVETFEDLISQIRLANNHLDIIYIPFSKVGNLDQKLLAQYRVVLRRYRDKIKENYNDIMKTAHRAVLLMGEFSSDIQTVEMMNSFISSLEDVRKQVNRLLGIFSDLGSLEFKDALLKGITLVKKEGNQVKQLVNDRILEHINTNILATNWINKVTDEQQEKVYERVPLVVELLEEREKALNGG